MQHVKPEHKQEEITPCAKANLMRFPDRPEELKLTESEERLVTSGIPFMRLHQLPRDGQVSLTGNVANVPENVNKTLINLPRPADEDECIPIKLKRKLSYEHHYQ